MSFPRRAGPRADGGRLCAGVTVRCHDTELNNILGDISEI